jgi:hypothetical protein
VRNARVLLVTAAGLLTLAFGVMLTVALTHT